MNASLNPVTIPMAHPAYLNRHLPITIIIASFFVLTVPLGFMGIFYPQILARFFVKPIFIWLLATTHFVITFAIYLQSQNLRYFNSTWTNRLIYFGIPIGIFVLFDLYSALEVALIAPGFEYGFRGIIRLMDNHHVTRQSYGVNQLFKKRTGQQFPGWMRPVEDCYFHVLTGLLLITFFAGGQYRPGSPLMMAGTILAAVLALVIIGGYLHTLRKAPGRKGVVTALFYFLFQSGSMALGIYQTALYLYCLAMHFVEYHVMMMPRCFETRLDDTSPTDRVFNRLRSNHLVFYAVVVALSGLATYMTYLTMGQVIGKSFTDQATPTRILLAMFDGLFVFHYFVEVFIWRFSVPFYRNNLSPLYFGNKKPAPVAVSVP